MRPEHLGIEYQNLSFVVFSSINHLLHDSFLDRWFKRKAIFKKKISVLTVANIPADDDVSFPDAKNLRSSSLELPAQIQGSNESNNKHPS